MRFSQLDRILELDKGASIKAVKCLSLSEEYLKDHFPRFPVMPGVLMLESMFQASMWLVRETNDFQHSTVALRNTKSLKFQRFLQPGSSLVVSAEIKKVEGPITKLKVSGSIDGEVSVSGRLAIESYNLAERGGRDEAVDHYMIHQFRKEYRRLWAPIPV
jgi:3-hydroxyacyl-[acyl-carrier-protein] dehydratase